MIRTSRDFPRREGTAPNFVARRKVGTGADAYIVTALLADWVSAEQTHQQITGTWGYYLSASYMAEMAGLLGRDADAADYRALAANIKTAFNNRFFNTTLHRYTAAGNGGTTGATQAAQALAPDAGLVPEGEPRPHHQADPGRDLTYAKGNYTSPQGTARSEWRRDATGITRFDVTVQANTKATVYVPAKSAAQTFAATGSGDAPTRRRVSSTDRSPCRARWRRKRAAPRRVRRSRTRRSVGPLSRRLAGAAAALRRGSSSREGLAGKSGLVGYAATSVFVDREAELGALLAAFDAAGKGRPQTLVIEGEAGIGKTTLVKHFVAQLLGVRLLRASGEESEAHVPFAMADQLLREAGAESDALLAGQHVPIGMELLELMASSADGADSVVFVDDAHLVDSESLRALLFAARRLAASRVLLILVVRGRADETLLEGWQKLATEPTGGVLTVGRLEPNHVAALGVAVGVAMTPDAARRLCEHTRGNPLHARAVLQELPAEGTWQHEHRPLPVPKSYAQLILRQLDRCRPEVVSMIQAAAVLGVRAPLHLVNELAEVEDPLATLDGALETKLVRLDPGAFGAFVEFSHPLIRVAIYNAIPQARRAALNTGAAELLDDPAAVMRHRIEAATVADDTLLTELEAQAHQQMSRGAWAAAVSNLLAASRLNPRPTDRERLALEAIEAMMYSGDGAAARRLAERASFADGPRRDSVLAYLAIFAGDLEAAQRLLALAWKRRELVDDDRLSATIAQRSAFLATSRLRGREAIEWVARAEALAPGDATTGRLVASSLALGSSFIGERDDAHAALDRWLEDPSAPRPGAGFVLLALKGFLLLADGDVRAARSAFDTSARESLAEGLLVVAALSLSGLTYVEYVAGAWDNAVVSSERAISLAIESEDQWVTGQAHWRASYVAGARGDWPVAEAHVRAIREQDPSFERHRAAAAIAAAGLAAAQERPADVLAALAPLERMRSGEGVDDPAFLPWHHLKAHALVDDGQLEAAEPFLDGASSLASSRANPLLMARLAHVRGKLEFARRRPERATTAFEEAHALIEPLAMPYEQALIELSHGQVLRRNGERRAAAAMLLAAHGRLSELKAFPAMQRCANELAACGLSPSARKTRDYTALTPQEVAVTRLVVSGMTNREVSEELMVSTKTVEFHLSNVYTKVGVRSRSELRARARANELTL